MIVKKAVWTILFLTLSNHSLGASSDDFFSSTTRLSLGRSIQSPLLITTGFRSDLGNSRRCSISSEWFTLHGVSVSSHRIFDRPADVRG